MPKLMNAALRLARRGFRVFPLYGVTGSHCDCGLPIDGHKSAGKHPRTRHGFHDATIDLATIRSWWRRWPNANIGIRTGDRLLVVDIDGPDGETSARALDLPPTVEATSGRGRHLYYRVDGPVPSTSGRLGPGIDTRGEGGYIIAPPSLHRSSKRYHWVRAPCDTEMAEAPSSNLSILCAVSPAPRHRKGADSTKRVAKPHKGDFSRQDRDWSRSGRDRQRAIQLLQQGRDDDEIFAELADKSEKYAEKLRVHDELIADDYLTRTIKSAHDFDARGRVIAVVERAEQEIFCATPNKPLLARIRFRLRTEDGERIDASMVVPSAGYPQARAMFEAVAPDLDPVALCDYRQWRLAHRLIGRELDARWVKGVIKWMRWRRRP